MVDEILAPANEPPGAAVDLTLFGGHSLHRKGVKPNPAPQEVAGLAS